MSVCKPESLARIGRTAPVDTAFRPRSLITSHKLDTTGLSPASLPHVSDIYWQAVRGQVEHSWAVQCGWLSTFISCSKEAVQCRANSGKQTALHIYFLSCIRRISERSQHSLVMQESSPGKAGGSPGNAFQLVYAAKTDKVWENLYATDPVLSEWIRCICPPILNHLSLFSHIDHAES